MSKLKVGDRVRIVAALEMYPIEYHVGRTGVIVAYVGGIYDWRVQFDEDGKVVRDCLFYSSELAPIDRDEAFDRFMKSLTTSPLVELVRETEKALLSGMAK